MKQKEISLYADWADRVAQLSTAERLKVGAVLVNGHFISCGYNGSPYGWDNCCEDILPDGSTKTKPEVIHAEENVLLKCAHDGIPTKGASLFITHTPCFNCATRIIQSGVKEVFFKNKYREDTGIAALLKSGISVTFLGEENELCDTGCENRQGSLF